MKNRMIPENIIISRTDSIGDVILTLPLAKFIKDKFPSCTVAFLGREYSRPVVRACSHVDQFISLNQFMTRRILIAGKAPQCIIHVFPHRAIARKAKEMGIQLRIGTTNRLFHWFTCNKLVKLSRKKSDLHEAQLNLKMPGPLGIRKDIPLSEIETSFGLHRIQPLSPAHSRLKDVNKYNLIIHPGSQGSSREWGLENFTRLISLLDQDRYKIFISGIEEERPSLDKFLETNHGLVTDIIGKMDLYQFMSFIKHTDGLLAKSTGPLHIAAALGKDAFGLYPSIVPFHPGRRAPLGKGATVFVASGSCNKCKRNPAVCTCMKNINPMDVFTAIENKAAKLR